MQLSNAPAGQPALLLFPFLARVALITSILACWDGAVAQTKVYVPQVIAGGVTVANIRTDFHTIFHVFNLASDTVRIRIRAFQDDGEPFLAFFEGGLIGGGQHLSEISYTLNGFAQEDTTTATGAPDTAGWALIEVLDFETNQPIESPITVAATLETRQRGLDGDTTRATLVVPTEPIDSFFAYARITSLTNLSGATGIALLNPSDADAVEVTLQLVEKHGVLEDTLSISLAPNHKIAAFLNDPMLFSELLSFEGSVEVRSTGPVSAAVIRVGQTFWSSFGIFPSRPIPGLNGNE